MSLLRSEGDRESLAPATRTALLPVFSLLVYPGCCLNPRETLVITGGHFQ